VSLQKSKFDNLIMQMFHVESASKGAAKRDAIIGAVMRRVK
jgi:hypothetical protein